MSFDRSEFYQFELNQLKAQLAHICRGIQFVKMCYDKQVYVFRKARENIDEEFIPAYNISFADLKKEGDAVLNALKEEKERYERRIQIYELRAKKAGGMFDDTDTD